jgi:hypothetical protein
MAKLRADSRTSFEGEVNVCAHRVVFRYWDFKARELTPEFEDALTEEAEERAKACIVEGYHSGELNCLYVDHEQNGDAEEITGWWEINRG